MHLRMPAAGASTVDSVALFLFAMSVTPSLVNADLALRRTSITRGARRCKAEP
jgi:hypothetical protein